MKCEESKVEQLHNLEDQAVFALTQLVGLYLKKNEFHRQPMFRCAESPFGDIWSLGAIIEAQEKSGVSEEALALLESPVSTSLRNAMTEIGRALYDHEKSTKMMRSVLVRVEDAFPDSSGRAASVLDHAFDGIGGWLA